MLRKPCIKEQDGVIFYQFPGFVVRYHPDKNGLGVFTTTFRKAGTLLPYGGVVISMEKASSLMKSASKVYADGTRNTNSDYLLVLSSMDQYVGKVLDAHPRHYPSNKPLYAWIGSLVNEPSAHETANAKLVLIEPEHPIAKAYRKKKFPEMQHDLGAFIELQVDVAAGEEITAVYGYSNRAHRKLGYLVGKDCFESSEHYALNTLLTNPPQYIPVRQTRNMTDEQYEAANTNVVELPKSSETRSAKRKQVSKRNINKINKIFKKAKTLSNEK